LRPGADDAAAVSEARLEGNAVGLNLFHQGADRQKGSSYAAEFR
jgi:hypothetical protein